MALTAFGPVGMESAAVVVLTLLKILYCMHVQTRYDKVIVDESKERCKKVVYDMILGGHINMAIAASGALGAPEEGSGGLQLLC